jgi:hypothetical protein
MVRKNTKKQSADMEIPADDKDIRYLQSVIRKFLAITEEAMEQLNLVDGEEFSVLHKKYELLFGAKASFAGTLVIVADLLIKLNPQAEGGKDGIPEEKQAYALSDADVALVQAFVRKLKGGQE